MTPTPPTTSPWRYETADHMGRYVRIEIAFNVSTRAIVNPGLTGTRDAGCLYTRVIIGRTGIETTKEFGIPEGSFSVSRTQLAGQALTTLDDILGLNFTLGF